MGLWPGTHINILVMLVARCCGGGGSQLNIVFNSLVAQGGGGVLYLELFLCLAVRSVSSPSVLVLAGPRSGPAQADAPARTPATGRGGGDGTAVVRHNIISTAEREGKACVAMPPPLLFTPPGFKCRASLQRMKIFLQERRAKFDPHPPPPRAFYCLEM